VKLIHLFDKTEVVSPAFVEIGGHKVAFISQTGPSLAHKTPLVILGSAFEGIDNFQYELEQISKDMPVYLVDLPGFGTNLQDAHDLNYDEYSRILKGFLDGQGIDKCSIAALSYSSSIGYTFASLYPDRVSKLMIGGITKKLRESVRVTLEQSMQFLGAEEDEKFASSVALNLMNFSQRHNIEKSEDLKKTLFHSLMQLNQEEKEKYKTINARLMDSQPLPRSPQCPVLIVGGEFDNFMTPYECYEVANNCSDSTFVVIKGADHLLSLEKKDVLTRLYRRFLADQPLNRMKDIEVFQSKEFPRERIRMEPRWLLNDVGYLDSGNGVFVPINIVDINNFGCRLYTSFKDHRSLQRTNKFLLHLPDEEIQMEVILFKQADNGHFRGIFQHYTFDGSRKFEGFIDKVAMNCSSAYAA